MILNKIKKVIRNPRLITKIRFYSLRKSIATKLDNTTVYQYGIVSAVYNMESYIDKFISSIVEQSCGFSSNIKIILVNDGSTDTTEKKIKLWQSKYPNNIVILNKNNGGQASARNFGLDYIKDNNILLDFITFTDPDDFLNKDYFSQIDFLIKKNPQIDIISTKFIYYDEDTSDERETHPLNFKFKGNKLTSDADKMSGLQMSMSTAVFRTAKIFNMSKWVSEDIKPCFEDAEFVNRFIIDNDVKKVGLSKNSLYYYRQRSSNDSTLNTTWSKKEHYRDVLQYGCLGLIEHSKKVRGEVSGNVKNAVLYHLIWYVKRFVDNPNCINFLSDSEKKAFFDLLHKILANFSVQDIIEFEISNIWYLHRQILLVLRDPTATHINPVVYLKGITDEELIFYCVSRPNSVISITIDGKILTKEHVTNSVRRLDEVEIYKESQILIPFDNYSSKVEVFIDDLPCTVKIGSQSLPEIVNIYQLATLSKYISSQCPLSVKQKRLMKTYYNEIGKCNPIYQDAVIIMDRDIAGDDNGEHFYRYLKNNTCIKNLYFSVRKGTKCWDRLEREGFNLLEFGSHDYELALLNAKYLISSHMDKYIVDYFGDGLLRDITNFKFVFLQHGVTKDDISAWCNSKNIDVFVTAAKDEYNSIVTSESNYLINPSKVLLSGFPRHDALISRNLENNDNDMILIMPTWRKSLVGSVKGKGNERNINTAFKSSVFLQCWDELLNSAQLREHANNLDCKVKFVPHQNLLPYLDDFNIPDYIEIEKNVADFQALFTQCELLITDYSSVAFEVAYLSKSVCYYQFDKHEVFDSGHFYEKGYFDYENDGFGPVFENVSDFDLIIANNGYREEKFEERRNNFFAYRDGKCNERLAKHLGFLHD